MLDLFAVLFTTGFVGALMTAVIVSRVGKLQTTDGAVNSESCRYCGCVGNLVYSWKFGYFVHESCLLKEAKKQPTDFEVAELLHEFSPTRNEG